MSAGSTSDGALAPHHVEGGLDQRGRSRRCSRRTFPGDADPRAAQAGRVEELRCSPARRARRRASVAAVARVGAGQRAEQMPRHRRRCGHRARRVLGVGDGNDAGAADQADGRLDADDAAGATTGRRSSRRSRCRGDRAEVGRHRRGRSRSWSRTGCGRARTGSGTARRGRSSRWTSGSSGCWPTR